MMTFGGYDVSRYAKQGMKDADIFWAQMSDSEKYWTVPMVGAIFDKEMKPAANVTLA